MKHNITLTAAFLAIVTFLSAQNPSQSFKKAFGSKYTNAKDHFIDSLRAAHSFSASHFEQLDMKKPMHSKSATSYTTRLDSIVEGEMYRGIYHYDANGNCTLEVYSYADVPNGWMPDGNVETAFDANNRVVDRSNLFWDPDLMAFQGTYRETYAYQENGLMTELIEYNWEMDEWVPMFKQGYEYDDEENLVLMIAYVWNQAAMEFEASSQATYEYNESGGLLERLRSSWAGSQWVPFNKTVHTLNDENQPLTVSDYWWQGGAGIWELSSLIEYTYNMAGLETYILHSDWSSTDEVFVANSKVERAYDDEDRMISDAFLFWNEAENGWFGYFMETYAYDDMDNVLEYTYHLWDNEVDQFFPTYKRVDTFNSEFHVSNIMGPVEYKDFVDHMILTNTYHYFIDDQWMADESAIFYYTPLDITSVNDVSTDAVTVYPNPFRETIRFSGSPELIHFTLYDLHGRMVLQKQVSGASEINTGDLPSGMYVYQVDGNDTRQVGKLVRE